MDSAWNVGAIDDELQLLNATNTGYLPTLPLLVLEYGMQPMIIAKEIVAKKVLPCPSGRDVVKLDWEARQKCRQRLQTEAGREIGLALPTGTVMSPGDILHRDAEVEIVVEGLPEKVFVLCPETTEDYGLVCYQVGNLHRLIGFDDGAILVPYEPVLEKQLCRLGFHYVIEEHVFTHVVRQSAPHAHVH